jgi:signal transduction histidine kinase
MREPQGDELAIGIAEIREAAERASSLAKKLLSIAELTAEKPADIEINGVVSRMSEILGRLVGKKVELSTRLEEGLGKVHVDLDRLERLVLNVVLNARDAMPAGGKVFIETSRVLRAHHCAGERRSAPKRYVTLSISDSGVGMDRATRERIFEPFFTTKSEAGGTGLGLSTALSFVHRNHGYIDVETEPGCGTTFRIGFPEVASEPMPANPRSE